MLRGRVYHQTSSSNYLWKVEKDKDGEGAGIIKALYLLV